MKKCKGFTLLEMIVVVMIISILFLLTVPNVSKIMSSVESVGCDALLKVVDAAVIEFKIEYGEYPGSINDLVNGGFLNDEQTRCSNGQAIYLKDGHAYSD